MSKCENITWPSCNDCVLIQDQCSLSSFSEQATQGQTTLLVVTGGTVKFEGNKQRFFNQNFLLTAQATPNNDQPVWKIASDCFRFQDWNSWVSPQLKCTNTQRWFSSKILFFSYVFLIKIKNNTQHWIRKFVLFSKCWTVACGHNGVINTNWSTKWPTVRWSFNEVHQHDNNKRNT